MKKCLTVLLALIYVHVTQTKAEPLPHQNDHGTSHGKNYKHDKEDNVGSEQENIDDFYGHNEKYSSNYDDFAFTGIDNNERKNTEEYVDSDYNDDWKQQFNSEYSKYNEQDEVDYSDNFDSNKQHSTDSSSNEYEGESYRDEKETTSFGGWRRRQRQSEKEPEYTVSSKLKNIMGLKGNKDSSDLLYQLTGTRDENSALEYIQRVAGLRNQGQTYEFIKRCRGSRTWKIIVEFIKNLEGTTDIRVFVDLLRELTGESDVFKAFDILRELTNHNDFDAVYECLQKISGARGPNEITLYFKHGAHSDGENNRSGLAGLRSEVLKLTGGIGPSELPRLLETLLPENDLKGTFASLMSSTKTEDIGDAIVELMKILRVPTFSVAIMTLKRLTRQSQLKYAIEELLQSYQENSLEEVIDGLYRITGTDNIEDAREVLSKVFSSDDAPYIAYEVRRISNKPKPLNFLSLLIEQTRSNDINTVSHVLRSLAHKRKSMFGIMEDIQSKSGHGIIDLFRKLNHYTGKRRIQEAWRVISRITRVNGIFELFDNVARLTDKDVTVFIATVIKATNTRTLPAAAAALSKVSKGRDFFEIMYTIRKETGMDVAEFFEEISTIRKGSRFEEIESEMEKYTETNDFMDAIKGLKAATGQTNYQNAIEHIKNNKPRVVNTRVRDRESVSADSVDNRQNKGTNSHNENNVSSMSNTNLNQKTNYDDEIQEQKNQETEQIISEVTEQDAHSSETRHDYESIDSTNVHNVQNDVRDNSYRQEDHTGNNVSENSQWDSQSESNDEKKSFDSQSSHQLEQSNESEDYSKKETYTNSKESNRKSTKTSVKDELEQVEVNQGDNKSQGTKSSIDQVALDKPTPPGQSAVYERGTETTAPVNAGGKLVLNQGKKDIYNALETDMNLKIVMLPDGPHGNNCFCTCDSNSAPKITQFNNPALGLIRS